LKPHALKTLIRQAAGFTQNINRRRPDAESIALEKRKMERKLRAAGHGRKTAMTMVAEHFKNRGE
jgi:hypothetical protein